jgi:hypothetical protein
MISDIAEMFVGKSADKDRSDRMNSTEFSTAIDWVLDHFTIVSFEEQPTANQVLEAFEEQMEVIKYAYTDQEGLDSNGEWWADVKAKCTRFIVILYKMMEN